MNKEIIEKENNKYIYIVQMHTNTIPANIVKIFTGYKYSHVSLSFEKNCDNTYSFGRRKVNNPLNGGFVKENKYGEFFKKFNKTMCRVFEIEVTKKQYDELRFIINKMEENKERYGYDFIGTFFRFFKIPVTFKNKSVCSIFLAEVLEKTKIYKFNKRLCFVKPEDFENMRNSKLIYEGKYLEYK